MKVPPDVAAGMAVYRRRVGDGLPDDYLRDLIVEVLAAASSDSGVGQLSLGALVGSENRKADK